MSAIKLIKLFLTLATIGLISGCSTITEEDPNSQQTPWASPAGWENNVPGMPGNGF